MSSREIEVEITREIAPYAPERELGIYKTSRWTFRAKQEAMMKASKPLDERRGLVQVDLVDFQMEQILACVVPPEGFDWNREQVEDLDPDVGDALLDACRKVNGTTISERTSFLEQSEQTEDTPG